MRRKEWLVHRLGYSPESFLNLALIFFQSFLKTQVNIWSFGSLVVFWCLKTLNLNIYRLPSVIRRCTQTSSFPDKLPHNLSQNESAASPLNPWLLPATASGGSPWQRAGMSLRWGVKGPPSNLAAPRSSASAFPSAQATAGAPSVCEPHPTNRA